MTSTAKYYFSDIFRKILLLSVLPIALSLVLGCHQIAPGSKDTKKQLLNQVAREWEAKIGRDWGTLYDLSASQYRKSISRERFVTRSDRSNLNYSGYQIKDVYYEKGASQADVKVEFTVNQMGIEYKFNIEEPWVFEKGEWKRYYNPNPKKSPIGGFGPT